MNRSKTIRLVALIASVCITFTMVTLIADYSHSGHGVHLASADFAKHAGKV
ncbi:MAG: hypothetical protein ABI564_11905 [Ideonella sp.]